MKNTPFYPSKMRPMINSGINISAIQEAKRNHVDFQLIGENDILVTGDYQLFDDNLKGILKIYGQGHYSYEARGYIIKLQNYESVIERIKIEKQSLILRQIPKLAFETKSQIDDKLEFKLAKNKISINYDLLKETIDIDKKLPKNFIDKLYQFQKDGIQFGIRAKGRLLIGDEMGVGKTIQALGLVYIYKNEWPLLIICPSSLRLNWRDEVTKWIPNIQSNQIQVITKSGSQIRSNASVIIISYDLATKMNSTLEKCNFKLAIADEAHYLKNLAAKRTETLCPILKSCKRIILLTGTPALNKPKELFSLLNIVRPDVFVHFRDFGTRYCDPKPSRWKQGLEYDGASNTKELHYILSKSIMIRRLKKDVLKELPSKRRQKFTVQVDSKIVKEIQILLSKISASGSVNFDEIVEKMMRENYQVTYNDAEYQAEKMDKDERTKILDIFHKCWVLTGKAKLKGIMEYLSVVIENGIKFLLFAHHLNVLTEIEEFLKQEKCQYVRIDGDVSMKQRHENVKQFQENPQIKAAILSLTAASVGLTLTEASTVIFAEMYWTPAVMLQAEDRAHRIGQVNCVNCLYMYGEGTLDEKLYEKLETKLTLLSGILDGQNSLNDQQNMFDDYITLNNNEVQEDIKVYNTYNGIGEPIKNKQITDYFQKKNYQIQDDESIYENTQNLQQSEDVEENQDQEYIVINRDKFKTKLQNNIIKSQEYDLDLVDELLTNYQNQTQYQDYQQNQQLGKEYPEEDNQSTLLESGKSNLDNQLQYAQNDDDIISTPDKNITPIYDEYEETQQNTNKYNTPIKMSLDELMKPIQNANLQQSQEKVNGQYKRKLNQFLGSQPELEDYTYNKKVKTNQFKFM